MQVWKSKFIFTLYFIYSLHRLPILWRWMPQESCCSGPWWLLEDHQTWNAVGRHPLPMSTQVFPASWAAWPKRSDINSKDLPPTHGILNQWQGWPLVRGKKWETQFWIFNIPLVRKKEASYSWPPSERFWSLCSTAISPNFTTIARSLSTVKSPLSIVFSCSKPQDKVVPSNKTIWVQWFSRVSRLFLISSKTWNLFILFICLFVVRLPRVFLVTCLVAPAIAWGTWTGTLSWSIPELDMFESFKKEGVPQVWLCLSHNCSFHVLWTKCEHHLWTYL